MQLALARVLKVMREMGYKPKAVGVKNKVLRQKP